MSKQEYGELQGFIEQWEQLAVAHGAHSAPVAALERQIKARGYDVFVIMNIALMHAIERQELIIAAGKCPFKKLLNMRAELLVLLDRWREVGAPQKPEHRRLWRQEQIAIQNLLDLAEARLAEIDELHKDKGYSLEAAAFVASLPPCADIADKRTKLH